MTYFSSQHQSSWIECKWKNTQIFHSKNNLVHKLQVTCRIVFGFWSFTWELKPQNKIVEPFPKVWPLGLHQRGFFFPAFFYKFEMLKIWNSFFPNFRKSSEMYSRKTYISKYFPKQQNLSRKRKQWSPHNLLVTSSL